MPQKKTNEAAALLLASMPYAVYAEAGGKIEAFFAEADHAAAFVAVLGDGAVVVASGPDGINPSWVLWTEGAAPADGSAGESYDAAANLMRRRRAVFDSRRAAGIHIGVARR